MINIFLIPSWYPTLNNYLSGIFIKEQSIMISETKMVTFFVSCIDEFPLTPRNIKNSLTNTLEYIFRPVNKRVINQNFVELWDKSFIWSKKLFKGNFYNIFKIRRKHLISLLSKQNIDIIHAHVSYPAGYIAYLLSKEFNIPYIITEHMSPFPFDSLLKNGKPIKEIEVAINNANEVVAVSNSLKNDICKYGLKEPIVIPNFIDEKEYNLSNQKKNKFVFLTVGNLIDQKGIDILIKAVYLLQKEINLKNKVEFRIVGNGEKEKIYKNLAENYGLYGIIKFVGRLNREAVKREFENCNAFVLPSRHESFGIVYIEALACGKPVIATRCGGPEMIVKSPDIGILVEKENIYELKKAIKDMFLNYHYYDLKKIRQYFLENFSKKVNVPKYIQLYKELTRV